MEIKKQIRGSWPKLRNGKRYLKIWERWADEMAHDFPSREDSPRGYWHQRLGFPPEVDGRRTPNAIRRQAIQAFLRGAENIRRNMPGEGFNRVLCGIAMPRIVYSDLTVFFSEDYFSNFFDRKSCNGMWCGSIWSQLPPERSLQREWGLQIPAGFDEIGVRKIYDEGDGLIESEMWWYGDIEGIAEQLK